MLKFYGQQWTAFILKKLLRRLRRTQKRTRLLSSYIVNVSREIRVQLLQEIMKSFMLLVTAILCFLLLFVHGESGYQVGVGIWDMTGPSVEVLLFLL